MITGASFSPCRTWRYALWRIWVVEDLPIAKARMCAFVGLNPSTADESVDDPTIRRCIRFARDWGYGGLYMLNLFAFRATDPKAMCAARDPVGPDNDKYILEYADKSELVVAAWGAHGSFMGRARAVETLLPKLHFLQLTKDGSPKHPLYLRADLKPELYSGRRGAEEYGAKA